MKALARCEPGSYEAFEKALGGTVRSMLEKGDDDSYQDAMLKCWRMADRYDETRAAPTTFVAMVAKCVRRDAIRRRIVRAEVSLERAGSLAMTQQREDPIRERRVALAQRFMATLDCVGREACELVYIRGLTWRQSAAILGVPVGTVKSRLHRAISQMREFTCQ